MKTYKGILPIGDPHVTQVTPGRRRDEDYGRVTLDKLSQSLRIARENDLFPIITGDLVNKPREESIVAPLIRVLGHDRVPLLLGNHDVDVRRTFKSHQSPGGVDFGRHGTTIPVDDDTTIGILWAAGCIDVFNQTREIQVPVEGRFLYRILMVPYGVAIPEVYPQYDGDHDGTIVNIMMTHHDLNFGVGRQYPGCAMIFPVEGCDLVINGHLHDHKPPFQEVDGTRWFNPGNIVRSTLANKDNVPAVYSFSGAAEEAFRHVLKHRPLNDIFNDRSTTRARDNNRTLVDFKSSFVESMRDAEGHRTGDGIGVQEMLENYGSEHNIDENVMLHLRKLLEAVTSD